MRQIEFGGPALPAGTRTWFYDLTLELEGEPLDYGVTHAYPGDRFPASQVKDAETYVARGMAAFIDEAPQQQEFGPHVEADIN